MNKREREAMEKARHALRRAFGLQCEFDGCRSKPKNGVNKGYCYEHGMIMNAIEEIEALRKRVKP
jgi:hypothetical protein